MDRKRPRKNRTSLVANILLFILGAFTLVFVDRTLGGVLVVLSIFLFILYLWLTRRYAKVSLESDGQP